MVGKTLLVFVTSLGLGLMAGLFFTFSAFAMQALNRIAPDAAIAAMRAINETIQRSLFMPVFLGTALLCLGTAAVAAWHVRDSGSALVIAGSLLYLIGTFGVTMVFNVPLNNRLDTFDPARSVAADAWKQYYEPWLVWNHVRTVSSTAALAAFTWFLAGH